MPLAVLWVGGIGGMEADLVKQASRLLNRDIPFRAIPTAGVHGVGWRKLPGNFARLSRGYFASRQVLRDFRPDILLFTGGYVAVPMALAGREFFMKKIPSVLYVPDIEPGLALKVLGRYADRIAATTEDTCKYFAHQERVSVTGYPVRPELLEWSREQAFYAFDLVQGRPVLLVLGGSSGAQSINRALFAALPGLLEDLQIIHISGERNWDEVEAVEKLLNPDIARHYHAYPYLHAEMGAALKAADLVVSRAGASCLGEYPSFGLPAILAPYPYAWRYQQTNAEYLASRGAAVILADGDLMENLSRIVHDLIHDPGKLASMQTAMLSLAHPDAAVRIADLVNRTAMEDRSRA